MGIRLKTPEDIEQLQKSGDILAYILKDLKDKAKKGVRLSELDKRAKTLLIEAGAKAAFFGFAPSGAKNGFPGHICASVNDQIVHGVPGKYKLKDGDLLKIDFGVDYKGYITDAALTIPIGEITKDAERLASTTRKALENAIATFNIGNRLGDVGYIIEKTVTDEGFSIIKSLTGHGVGFELHEEPTVYNFGEKGIGTEIVEGMVVAIEPITSLGSGNIKNGPKESYVTADGSLSAHFEKTIAATKNGPKVLTPWDK